MDKHLPLTEQLDKYRPDMQPCAEYALKDRLDSAAMQMVSSGRYAGMTKLEAAANAILDKTIEDPSQSGAATLGDLVKLSQPRKQKVEVDAGSSLLNVFARFNDPAEEIIDPTEDLV